MHVWRMWREQVWCLRRGRRRSRMARRLSDSPPLLGCDPRPSYAPVSIRTGLAMDVLLQQGLAAILARCVGRSRPAGTIRHEDVGHRRQQRPCLPRTCPAEDWWCRKRGFFEDHSLGRYADGVGQSGRERCQCGEELINIDNRGEHFTGCLYCNRWEPIAKRSMRLSEDDLRALRLQHGCEE